MFPKRWSVYLKPVHRSVAFITQDEVMLGQSVLCYPFNLNGVFSVSSIHVH